MAHLAKAPQRRRCATPRGPLDQTSAPGREGPVRQLRHVHALVLPIMQRGPSLQPAWPSPRPHQLPIPRPLHAILFNKLLPNSRKAKIPCGALGVKFYIKIFLKMFLTNLRHNSP